MTNAPWHRNEGRLFNGDILVLVFVFGIIFLWGALFGWVAHIIYKGL